MDLQSLSDLVAVVQAGGISAGARISGQPKQSISRRLQALETSLGLRLFERSTRALRLTADGVLLHERASRILADVDDVRRALADRHQAPEGLLRISAPVLLGQTLLGGVVAQLSLQHPKLRIEVVLSDKRVDLIEDGFDAALRVGPVEDSSLVGRVFARSQSIVVAAPAFLSHTGGPPLQPAELAQQPCVLFGESLTLDTWRFQRDDVDDNAQPLPVLVHGQVIVTSMKLALDVAIAGAGLASLPAFIAKEAIAAGKVVRVLPHWHTGQADLRVVFSSRRLLSARLRTFIDALVAAFPDQRLG